MMVIYTNCHPERSKISPEAKSYGVEGSLQPHEISQGSELASIEILRGRDGKKKRLR